MDQALINALLNPKPRKAKKEVKPNALIRTESGVEQAFLKPSEFGEFRGKLGSTKRSRKGRSYRAANGSVKYEPNWETEVIAYKA
jgi:hypothetical protein